MNINTLLQMVQSANVNFLVGSGVSAPYLKVLGNVEQWLHELEKKENLDEKEALIKKFVQASILKSYIDGVMAPNRDDYYLRDEDLKKDFDIKLGEYKSFLTTWHGIMSKRGVKLISKQMNIFTTNIDIFFERAAERVLVEMNDGFSGGLSPSFSENNFHKSINKSSMFYHHNAEVPVFNLQKIHGSIHWKKDSNFTIIKKDTELRVLQNVILKLKYINRPVPYDISSFTGNTQQQIREALEKGYEDWNDIEKQEEKIKTFISAYDDLVMINPTKAKFSSSVIDLHFYELMRLMSNSLEKENSLLFVMGFSFADEHLAEIIMRSLNANPTLLMVVFLYKDTELSAFKGKLKKVANNSNVVFLTPQRFTNANMEEPDLVLNKDRIKVDTFDLESINRVFANIDSRIPIRLNHGK